MSKDYKSLLYFMCRRGWHDQMINLCDTIASKKGKDPVCMFWKAYGLGMRDSLPECIAQLEAFSSRKDMQYPVTLALLYFHKRASKVDKEMVDTLASELNIAEDVTKDAGMIIAARFALFTNDLRNATRICSKVLSRLNKNNRNNNGNINPIDIPDLNAQTPAEIEACVIMLWSVLAEGSAGMTTSEFRRALQPIESFINNVGSNIIDADAFMLLSQAKIRLGQTTEAQNVFNQCIASFPSFAPCLCEKALLLAGAGDWEHCLDTAQRAMDLPIDMGGGEDNLDALKCIAVHAFTQEAQPQDASQKLDDLEDALSKKEPQAGHLAAEAGILFGRICCRHPRALQVCSKLLQRAVRLTKSPDNICALGQLSCMLGDLDLAGRMFREASKIDAGSIAAIEGLISVQLIQGELEDAQSQIELLQVMQSDSDFASLTMDDYGNNNSKNNEDDDESASVLYLQAELALRKARNGGSDQLEAQNTHVALLDRCKDAHLRHLLRWRTNSGSTMVSVYPGTLSVCGKVLDRPFGPLGDLVEQNPDFLLQVAMGYLAHLESPLPSTIPPNVDTNTTGNNSLMGGGGNTGATTLGYGFGAGPNAMNNNNNNNNGGGAASGTATRARAFGAGSRKGMTMQSVTAGMLTLSGGLGNSDSNAMNATAGSLTGISDINMVDMPTSVKAGLELFQRLLKAMPGMITAYVQTARCLSGSNDHEGASRALRRCLQLQPHCAPALLALARVEIMRTDANAADRALEQSVSADFGIRHTPLYKLTQSIIRAQQGRVEDALEITTELIQLPEVANATAGSVGGNVIDILSMSDEDRVAAFVVHAQLLSRQRRMKEAHKVLAEAKVVFAGSPQALQVLVASAQLAVEKGDYESAVHMLDKVTIENSSYVKAQLLKADILLNQARDKEGYTACYQNLVDRDACAKNFALLGQAYLRILNPEAAVTALEQAYRLDPSNAKLRTRIGRALTSTHEYHRAIDFYEAILRESRIDGNSNSKSNEDGKSNGSSIGSDLVPVAHDLAKLYMKLGRAESAVRVLEDSLHHKIEDDDVNEGKSSHNGNRNVGGADVDDLRQDVLTLLLLVKVKESSLTGSNSPSSHDDTPSPAYSRKEISDALLKARDRQRDVISTLRGGGASKEVVDTEKTRLSELCQRLGAWYLQDGNNNEAESELAASLEANPHNVETMLTLANMYRSRGGDASAVELCRAQCRKVISSDPTNEAATIILSESLFSTDESDEAVVPLHELLKECPSNYHALEKIIILLRRSGRLDEVPPYMEAAAKADSRSASHPGYHFCSGLYARFTNDPIKAVQEFNRARRDAEWGPDSLVYMIELYLNPDNDSAWEGVGVSASDTAVDENHAENIAVAESLLEELTPKARDKRRLSVLKAYCSLATRQKSKVEEAMRTFVDLLEQDQDYLPAVLGMATGFMVEKRDNKAKNLLRRVGTLQQQKADGEDYEKAILLLAKFNMDTGNHGASQELCQRCLSNNRSCSTAWEILGMGYEKKGEFDKAAECYEHAWKLEFKASASTGYKLAFSYLQEGRNVDAIDICEHVLQQFPDYPRIRTEILKKAQYAIRSS